MGTAIYKRVSTHKQEDFGVSLGTQQEKLQAYCSLKNLDNTKDYTDVGSARNTDRPDFQRLMRDIKVGKIKNVVVWRLDRLTRSIADLDKLVRIFNQYGCALHSATESLDTSTANGRMMVNVIAIFAQWESESISERVSVNMQSLAEKGVWMSALPFGFDLGEDKRLVINEKEASILREGFQLVLQGESFTSAQRKINRKYNTDFNRNYFSRKVRHATTVGDIERNGLIIPNTHEPIITKEEQAKLIQVLNSNMTGRNFTDYKDIYRRRVECPACKNTLVLVARKKLNGSHYHSYTCNHCHEIGNPFMSVSENKITEAFMSYMKTVQIEGMGAELLEDVNQIDEIKALKRLLKDINSKRDKLQRAWLSDLLSDEDLAKYKTEIEVESLEVEEALSKLTVVNTGITDDELKMIASNFNMHFNDLDQEQKRAFVQQHVKRITFTRELVKGYKRMYHVEIENVEFF